MKNIKRNSVIIFIISLLLIFYIVKDNYKEAIFWFCESNKLFLLFSLMLYFISFLLDSYSFYIIINQYDKKYSLKDTIRLNIMTKFFNGITPLSTGGQPLQLYELYKSGVSLNSASNIVIQFYIIFQIALVILSTFAIILNKIFHIFVKNVVLRNLVVIGYVINLVILLVLFFISFNRNFNKKIICFVVKILSSLRIVKDKYATTKKWELNCDNFHSNAKVLIKHPKTLITGVALQIIQLLFLYAVPLVVIWSMDFNTDLTLLSVMVASSYVFLVGCYVPIPGGTGGMEFGFLGFFSNFVGKGTLHAATILWRVVTYFIPVIVGGIVFNIKNSKDNICK